MARKFQLFIKDNIWKIIIGISFIVMTIEIFGIATSTISDASKISLVIISLSALVAGLAQLSANHDWNRRSLTIVELTKYVEKLREYRMQLDALTNKEDIIELDGKFISFTDRVNFYRGGDTEVIGLTGEEMHNWVCEKDDEGKIIEIKDTNKNEIYKTTESGEKIVHYVLLIINTYENIAIAIKHGVFDKAIVLDEIKDPIIKNFEFFKDYIYHRRKRHGSVKFAENLEALYEELTKEKRKTTEERRLTDG